MFSRLRLSGKGPFKFHARINPVGNPASYDESCVLCHDVFVLFSVCNYRVIYGTDSVLEALTMNASRMIPKRQVHFHPEPDA